MVWKNEKTLFCTAIGKILPRQPNHHLCSPVSLWHTLLQHARGLDLSMNALFFRLLCNAELCKGHCFCKGRNIHWYFSKSCAFCRLNESLFSGLFSSAGWSLAISEHFQKSSKTSQLLLKTNRQDRPRPKLIKDKKTNIRIHFSSNIMALFCSVLWCLTSLSAVVIQFPFSLLIDPLLTVQSAMKLSLPMMRVSLSEQK